MKSMMLLMVAAVLCAGEAMAQGRRGGANAAGGKSDGAMITIREITGVGGDSDYTVVAPQIDEKFKKKVNHTDSYKKDNVKGWHYFEVAYQVKNGDPVAKKPILVLPEVEITYALLYDMKKSKIAASVAQNAKKAGGAIGWDDPKQLYSLITETFTYTSITPGREHYAAVCVPPSSVAVYGDPILFSVQIKVNGVQQGEIKTDPHWVPATWRSLAHTSIKAELPSGNVPTTRVLRRISRFSRSITLLVRIRVQSS